MTIKFGQTHFPFISMNSRYVRIDWTKLLQKNTCNVMAVQAEGFQNHFTREKGVIDKLNHHLNDHENTIANYPQDQPVAMDHNYSKNHSNLIDRMETFEKLWGEIRADFVRFLAVWS